MVFQMLEVCCNSWAARRTCCAISRIKDGRVASYEARAGFVRKEPGHPGPE